MLDKKFSKRVSKIINLYSLEIVLAFPSKLWSYETICIKCQTQFSEEKKKKEKKRENIIKWSSAEWFER